MMDKQASAASYAASVGTAGAGVLTFNNIAIAIGILFTILTFIVNWRYQKQRLALDMQKRAEDAEFHRARMQEALKDQERELSECKGNDGDK